MTIYTRFGLGVEIIGNAGLISSDELNKTDPDSLGNAWLFPLNLVKVRSLDEGPVGVKVERFKFVQYLKASMGEVEIDVAMQMAPMLELSDAERRKAILDAL